MNALALIEALEAEGMAPEAIIRVLKGAEKKRDNTNAERQARYRAKRKPAKDNARYSNGVTPPNDIDILTPREVTEAKASSPQPWALPVGVSPQVWNDLLTNRKRKRLPNTDTAWQKFNADLATVSAQTGIPPPKLIEQCTAKGWGAIYDPREQRHGPRAVEPAGKSQAAYAMLNIAPGESF